MEQFISINSKEGQAWSLDIVIASVIFMIGIIVLYLYAINYLSKPDERLKEMFYEGNLASELILSKDDFGILTGHKVNQTKLDSFNSTYQNKKSLLGIRRNFYFVIDGLELGGSPAEYVGAKNPDPENIVQITRITIYKDKPAKFQLYVWE